MFLKIVWNPAAACGADESVVVAQLKVPDDYPLTSLFMSLCGLVEGIH